MSDYGLDPSVVTNPEFREKANSLLSPYGLRLPEYQGPNVILPNSGFFGNHPKISAALEGAMFGAAYTQPSETVGEGISNVIRGAFFEGPAAKRQMEASRYMAPFNAAKQMEQLSDMQGQRQLRDAQIQNMQDRSANQATANYYKFLENQARDQQRQENMNPWAFHWSDQSTGEEWGMRKGSDKAERIGPATMQRPHAPTAEEDKQQTYQMWLKDNNLKDSSKSRLRFDAIRKAADRAPEHVSPWEAYDRAHPEMSTDEKIKGFNELQTGARDAGHAPSKQAAAKQHFLTSKDDAFWALQRDENGQRVGRDMKKRADWYDKNIGIYDTDPNSQGIETPLPSGGTNSNTPAIGVIRDNRGRIIGIR
jgi:hypothetical protein